MIQLLSEPWAIRALLAASMVGVMCGVLGCFVVLRNMALIGDALSHAVLPGVVVGFIVAGSTGLGIFLGATTAGLMAAVAITWMQHTVKTKPDAAIGIVFTSMFAVGIMGISWLSKTEGVHLDMKDFLFGNVLGVRDQDLILTAMVMGYVLLSVTVFYRFFFATTFQPVAAQTMGISVKTTHYFLMLLLSFSVVASLQTVGVILVVAMLVTPASAALLLSNRLQHVLIIAALIGLLSAVAGFFVAVAVETTPGPAMTVMSTFIYLLAVCFAPRKGIVFQKWHSWKRHAKVRREDVLKQSLKLHEAGQLSEAGIVERLGMAPSKVSGIVGRLCQEKLMERRGDTLAMTTEGIATATRLVRAHRLWETYLVRQMGLNTDQIHDEAEHFEHLLTDEFMDEMDAHLGFPEEDPHGSPIPPGRS